jgi:hypothetical protein
MKTKAHRQLTEEQTRKQTQTAVSEVRKRTSLLGTKGALYKI